MTYTTGDGTHILNGFDVISGYTFHLLGFREVGLPPITRITQRGAFQQGDTNIDFRLNPRVFSIEGLVEASNAFEHMQIRQVLGRIFKVSNTASQVQYTTTDGVTVITRAIDCLVNGNLDISSDTSAGYDVYYTIELRADNPLWYDPNQNVLNLTGTVIGDPTDIPAVIPRTYGTNGLDSSSIVSYNGTFASYPVITVFGGDAGLQNLTIANVTTNKVIYINSIPVNATYTIDLRYGYKTVVDQNGVNRITNVNPQSNLTTFAIVPSNSYTAFDNEIVVECDNASNNSFVTIYYYTQYTSI
jgi:hypothetical protein